MASACHISSVSRLSQPHANEFAFKRKIAVEGRKSEESVELSLYFRDRFREQLERMEVLQEVKRHKQGASQEEAGTLESHWQLTYLSCALALWREVRKKAAELSFRLDTMESWDQLYTERVHRRALRQAMLDISLPEDAQTRILESLHNLVRDPSLEAQWNQTVWDCLQKYPTHFPEFWPKDALDVLDLQDLTITPEPCAGVASGFTDDLSLGILQSRLTRLESTISMAVSEFTVSAQELTTRDGRPATANNTLSENDIATIGSWLAEYAQEHEPRPSRIRKGSTVGTSKAEFTAIDAELSSKFPEYSQAMTNSLLRKTIGGCPALFEQFSMV